MTTIKPALDIAARAAIASRTEALFRSSGAFREGHFLLKSGRHGDAYVEKFHVLSDPAATSELCGYWAAHVRERARCADGRPRRRPDDGRRAPRLRDGPPARRALDLRRGGHGGRRHHAPRVPARLPHRTRRARPPRRRHPHDRRVAAGDAPGRRGDGRRHRGVRRPGRPQRRPGHADVAAHRADVPAAIALAAGPARPTNRVPRPVRAAPTARPLYAPGSTGTTAGAGGPGAA